MKTKLIELSQSLDGVFKAQFEIPRTEIEEVKKLRGCEVSLEVKKWRNKRSLDANAYAWVLISEMAVKLEKSKEEIYLQMLKDYGVSLVVSVKSEEDIKKIEKAFKYYEPFGSGIVGEKHFTHYKIYIGSSGYDTKEMTTFIKGIVQECEQLGIQTMTESELMKLEGLK